MFFQMNPCQSFTPEIILHFFGIKKGGLKGFQSSDIFIIVNADIHNAHTAFAFAAEDSVNLPYSANAVADFVFFEGSYFISCFIFRFFRLFFFIKETFQKCHGILLFGIGRIWKR